MTATAGVATLSDRMVRKTLLKLAVRAAQWHNRTFHRHDPPRYLITGIRSSLTVNGRSYPVELSESPPVGGVWYAVSGMVSARGPTLVAAQEALRSKLTESST